MLRTAGAFVTTFMLAANMAAGTPHIVPWNELHLSIDLPKPYGTSEVEVRTSNLKGDLTRVITVFKIKTQKGMFELPSSSLAQIKNPALPHIYSWPMGGTRFSFVCDKNQPEDFFNEAVIGFNKGELTISLSPNENIPY